MSEKRLNDAAEIRGARMTRDGYLVAEAFVAREGVQTYRGSEVGMPDREFVRVYRPASEVTDANSVQGYSHTPITMGHPQDFVDAKNWASLAKGEVSTEAEWRDGKLRLPLIVKDAAAIQAVQSGTRELSAGYLSEIEFKDGVTPEGEPYDAVQKNIRINHLAIVAAGRAGSECRIGDADTWGIAPITTSSSKGETMTDALKTVVLGDSAAQMTADAAMAVEAFKASMTKRLTDAETAHAEALKEKDKQLATAEAERDEAKAKILSDADLDARVAERADLLARAAKLAPEAKVAGLGDEAIRAEVVKIRCGDAAVEGKSADYIAARFDGLAELTGTDPLRGAFKDAAPRQINDQDAGWGDALTAAGVAKKGA